MSSAADIEVSPKELRFRCTLSAFYENGVHVLRFVVQIGKSIPSHVVLHNPTTERHAFKVKYHL